MQLYSVALKSQEFVQKKSFNLTRVFLLQCMYSMLCTFVFIAGLLRTVGTQTQPTSQGLLCMNTTKNISAELGDKFPLEFIIGRKQYMFKTLIVTITLSGLEKYLRCSIVAHIISDVFSIRTLGITTSYHCRCIVDNLKQTFESYSSKLLHISFFFLIHSSTGSIEIS